MIYNIYINNKGDVVYMEFIFYVILAFVILGIMLIVGNKHYDNGNIKHENIEATYISGIDNLIGEYKCTLSTLDSKLLVYISCA